ncbi:hypothetical protein CCACVL1_28853 [Corchorus capsularis]|uniref:Uncharacterized protein n=1 Tax=Corchorus capsularis TaxID=210143 RepID=A0A1R3G4Z9_COCAP|nr:hypothetical protein CCACVL1_28853 [Corchorus capsularis]
MSEKDNMCYFLESLKFWAKTESSRSRVQDVVTVIMAAERLNDYNESSSKRKSPPSSNGENSPLSGEKTRKDGQ